MEDVSVWQNLIGQLGFPIFAFLLMFYMCNKTIKEFKDSTSLTLTSLKQSIDSLIAIIKNKEDKGEK